MSNLNDLLTEGGKRKPEFARHATLNWAAALAFEIEQEYGPTPAQQYRACVDHFASKGLDGGASANKSMVEPLLLSLTNAMALCTLSEAVSLQGRAWMMPSASVTWYYATYMAVRSMLASIGLQDIPETHRGTTKSFDASLRRILPHPVNVVSIHRRAEDYRLVLEAYPEEKAGCNLADAHEGTRGHARGMLLGYISGTTKREVDIIKARLRKKNEWEIFRTKVARHASDEALSGTSFNFLNCAFRFRGKANYRDAAFLVLGPEDGKSSSKFVTDLAVSSQFMFTCALALFRTKSGKRAAREFISDAATRMRGVSSLSEGERFWIDLPV